MMSYNSQGGTGPKAVQAMINDMKRDLEQKTKVLIVTYDDEMPLSWLCDYLNLHN